MKGAAPNIGGIVNAVVVVLVVLLFGWFILAWAVLKRPILALPVAGFVGLVVLVGSHDAQALVLWGLLALGVWRVVHKGSFERLVGHRLRSAWVRWWVYERRWRNTMILSGLGKRMRMREAVPSIEKVRSTPWCHRVLVRLLLGQCTEDFERVTDELAHSFGAEVCRVREHRPGWLWLDFRVGDPLLEPIAALPVPETVDLMAVPVGLQEDGEPVGVGGGVRRADLIATSPTGDGLVKGA